MIKFYVKVNDREVANPALKIVIALTAFIIVGVVSAVVIFFVLPLLSIAVGIGVGLLCAFIIAIATACAVFLVGGGLLAGVITAIGHKSKG